MHSFYDYKKFAILYVDDEEKSLKYFTRAFDEHFRILTASNAADGFRLLEQHKDEIGVLMTDQRMPGEKGVQLLEKARQLRPKIIRILATAYSDIEAAVDAVNSGAIYKYVNKPWDVPQLEMTLRRALEFFLVQRERDSLMREKLAVLHHIMITDRVVSLGALAAGLGHHIRNSLVAIRTFLDLAPDKMREEKIDVEELRNPNFWQDFYEHVQVQVRRILDMLADLGMAAEPVRQTFDDKVSLKNLVNEMVTRQGNFLSPKKIIVHNNIPADLPELQVDRRKFDRLFELLFRDEATNLPEGATIELTATKLPSMGELEQVQLTLSDNGPGLPADAMRSIFDPFYVRIDDPQEFGLNLMACFFIVYHHGGTIEVRNNTNAPGATFVITLPTNPYLKPAETEKDFLAKVLSNEALWEKLLSGMN
jgi:two-component system probable response regulator PhcQ